MSFQVGIGSLGGTVLFQVGLCTPLWTMLLWPLLGCNYQDVFRSELKRIYICGSEVSLISNETYFKNPLNPRYGKILTQQKLQINWLHCQIWLKSNSVDKFNSINILINLSLSQNVVTCEQENANIRMWDNESTLNII